MLLDFFKFEMPSNQEKIIPNTNISGVRLIHVCDLHISLYGKVDNKIVKIMPYLLNIRSKWDSLSFFTSYYL